MFEEFIQEFYVVVIPVLYIIGMFIKNTEFIKDKFIPLILMCSGIVICVSIALGNNAQILDGILQGVLCAGAAVLTNQLIKQTKE